MKHIKYIIAGIAFGVIMIKSEAASWYRIQEMFHFHSFRMYGIIGSAVVTGIIAIKIIRSLPANRTDVPALADKTGGWKKYLFGGILFGLGWALCGACPGPLFVDLGYGYLTMLIPITGALAGTFTYGLVRNRLPH